MIALMYHDVVEPGADDASGFPGKDAARYKVSTNLFERHLAAIGAIASRPAVSAPDAAAGARPVLPARPALAAPPALPAPPACPALPILTFDDGGVSALRAADILERYRLRGCFFVTANCIGTRGFVDRRDICDLHARGHLVGSHSCSHPLRMGHCTPERLLDEWTRSRNIISGILGAAISVASVPGGDYAPAVAEAAAEAGFTNLFTSEPTGEASDAFGLALRGRFTIQRWTSPAAVAALARGDRFPAARQAFVWKAKKITKRLGGEQYLRLRQLLIGHGDEVEWGDRSTSRPATHAR